MVWTSYDPIYVHCMCAYTHTPCIQRSIEDEIERESQAEISTILISYLLMFVYIMFFLGHIRSIKTLLVREALLYVYAWFKESFFIAHICMVS